MNDHTRKSTCEFECQIYSLVYSLDSKIKLKSNGWYYKSIMRSDLLEVIKETLLNLADDLRSVRDEKIIQGILKSQLSLKDINLDERVILRSEEFPEMEIDLLGDDFAIELKVNPRFYDGVGQVLAIRELYGIETILVQIWRELKAPVRRALERIALRANFHVVLLDLRSRSVVVI